MRIGGFAYVKTKKEYCGDDESTGNGTFDRCVCSYSVGRDIPAANKALRTKVTFNGDKESDEAWMNNNYVMQAGYKKASKIKKNMKMSAKVYVPAAA